MKVFIPVSRSVDGAYGDLLHHLDEVLLPGLHEAGFEPWLIVPDRTELSSYPLPVSYLTGTDDRRDGELITPRLVNTIAQAVSETERFVLLDWHYPGLPVRSIRHVGDSYRQSPCPLWIGSAPTEHVSPFVTVPIRPVDHVTLPPGQTAISMKAIRGAGDTMFVRAALVDEQLRNFKSGWHDLSRRGPDERMDLVLFCRDERAVMSLQVLKGTVHFSLPMQVRKSLFVFGVEAPLNSHTMLCRMAWPPFWTSDIQNRSFKTGSAAPIHGRQDTAFFNELVSALIFSDLPSLRKLSNREPVSIKEILLSSSQSLRVSTPLDWLKFCVQNRERQEAVGTPSRR